MDKNGAIAEYNIQVEKNLDPKVWYYKSKEEAYADIKNKKEYADPDQTYEDSLSVY